VDSLRATPMLPRWTSLLGQAPRKVPRTLGAEEKLLPKWTNDQRRLDHLFNQTCVSFPTPKSRLGTTRWVDDFGDRISLA